MPITQLNGTGPDGDSAYEVAVAEGFVGTEQQWLDSLVGPQGDTGPQGIQGEPGVGGGGNTAEYVATGNVNGEDGPAIQALIDAQLAVDGVAKLVIYGRAYLGLTRLAFAGVEGDPHFIEIIGGDDSAELEWGAPTMPHRSGLITFGSSGSLPDSTLHYNRTSSYTGLTIIPAFSDSIPIGEMTTMNGGAGPVEGDVITICSTYSPDFQTSYRGGYGEWLTVRKTVGDPTNPASLVFFDEPIRGAITNEIDLVGGGQLSSYGVDGNIRWRHIRPRVNYRVQGFKVSANPAISNSAPFLSVYESNGTLEDCHALDGSLNRFASHDGVYKGHVLRCSAIGRKVSSNGSSLVNYSGQGCHSLEVAHCDLRGEVDHNFDCDSGISNALAVAFTSINGDEITSVDQVIVSHDPDGAGGSPTLYYTPKASALPFTATGTFNASQWDETSNKYITRDMLSRHIHIHHNEIKNAFWSSISTHAGGGGLHIHDNRMFRGDTGTGAQGQINMRSPFSRIYDNVLECLSTVTGIWKGIEISDWFHHIHDNHITGFTTAGIDCSIDAKYCLLENNTTVGHIGVTGTTGLSVAGDFNVVKGHTAYYGERGIVVQGADNRLSNLVVFDTSERAVSVNKTTSLRNKIKGIQVFRTDGVRTGVGVRLDEGARDNLLTDVEVYGFAQGLRTFITYDNVIDGFIVSDCNEGIYMWEDNPSETMFYRNGTVSNNQRACRINAPGAKFYNVQFINNNVSGSTVGNQNAHVHCGNFSGYEFDRCFFDGRADNPDISIRALAPIAVRDCSFIGWTPYPRTDIGWNAAGIHIAEGSQYVDLNNQKIYDPAPTVYDRTTNCYQVVEDNETLDGNRIFRMSGKLTITSKPANQVLTLIAKAGTVEDDIILCWHVSGNEFRTMMETGSPTQSIGLAFVPTTGVEYDWELVGIGDGDLTFTIDGNSATFGFAVSGLDGNWFLGADSEGDNPLHATMSVNYEDVTGRTRWQR